MPIYSARIKIHPSSEDINFFYKCINNQRFYYNQGIKIWENMHSLNLKPNKRSVRNEVRTLIKAKSLSNKDGEIYENTDFLDETPSNILDSAFENLGFAYDNFFRKGKKEGYAKNRPRFKSKRKAKESFTISYKTESTFKYDKEERTIKFTRGPLIKLSENLVYDDLMDTGGIRSLTISKNAYGWYISVTYEITHYPFECESSDDKIGIDLGVKDFAIGSELLDDGSVFKVNPIDYGQNERRVRFLRDKIKRLNKFLSKKRLSNANWKTSKKYQLLKNKIALAYKRISNLNEDFLQKFTTELVRNFRYIAIENLKIKNMMKMRSLAKAIQDSTFYRFKEILTYKAEAYGCVLTIAGSFFPSTKTCSCCGNIKDKVPLKVRTYNCDKCGISLDRDYNAALNLRKLIP